MTPEHLSYQTKATGTSDPSHAFLLGPQTTSTAFGGYTRLKEANVFGDRWSKLTAVGVAM